MLSICAPRVVSWLKNTFTTHTKNTYTTHTQNTHKTRTHTHSLSFLRPSSQQPTSPTMSDSDRDYGTTNPVYSGSYDENDPSLSVSGMCAQWQTVRGWPQVICYMSLTLFAVVSRLKYPVRKRFETCCLFVTCSHLCFCCFLKCCWSLQSTHNLGHF